MIAGMQKLNASRENGAEIELNNSLITYSCANTGEKTLIVLVFFLFCCCFFHVRVCVCVNIMKSSQIFGLRNYIWNKWHIATFQHFTAQSHPNPLNSNIALVFLLYDIVTVAAAADVVSYARASKQIGKQTRIAATECASVF